LLAALDPETGLSEFDKKALISSLESFNMRWVLVGKNAQELESLYQKCANGLRRGELDVSKIIERFVVEAPGDEAVQATFQEPVSSAPIVKLILFRIEQQKQGQVLPPLAKSVHIDWVAPQKDSPAWISTLFPAETEDMTLEYSTTVEQWGNKVIVDPALPLPARSASFSEKVSGTPEYVGYAQSQFATTRELANLTAWNRQAIKARNTAIGQAACDIWGV
jgi:hypothetical protein